MVFSRLLVHCTKLGVSGLSKLLFSVLSGDLNIIYLFSAGNAWFTFYADVLFFEFNSLIIVLGVDIDPESCQHLFG